MGKPDKIRFLFVQHGQPDGVEKWINDQAEHQYQQWHAEQKSHGGFFS
jgi:hypothetical protein